MIKNLSIIIIAKNECDNLKNILPTVKKISSDIIVIDGH